MLLLTNIPPLIGFAFVIGLAIIAIWTRNNNDNNRPAL